MRSDAVPCGRFAPSTTGEAHPGTLLAALLAWLDARSRGDRFIVRLENLDHTRCRPAWAEQMLADLRWLGLDWDELVDQTATRAHHEAALDALAAAGRLYPCACTRADRAGGQRAPDGGWAYPNTCRARPLPAGGWRAVTEAVRVRLDDDRVALIDEGGLDLSQTPAVEMGDPVVVRRDGVLAYQLVVVVDDAVSGVTRVIRGRDIAPSTATQVLLQRLLAVPTPTYRHHFLLLEPRGDKLAKLHGSISAAALRARHDARALCGLLAAAAGLRDIVAVRAARAARHVRLGPRDPRRSCRHLDRSPGDRLMPRLRSTPFVLAPVPVPAPVLVLLLGLGLAAGCGAGDDDTVPEYDFAITAPLGTSELLPDGTIPITWRLAGPRDAQLTIDLVSVTDDGAYTIVDETVGAGAGGGPWAGLDVDGALVPPDVYDLVATVLVDNGLVGSALRNVSVHGAYFIDPFPGLDVTVTGTEGMRDLRYVTVSQRVIRLVTSLDPDIAVDGDELVIDERSIPGEFVPFIRIVHFEGTTLEGAAIPQGDYTLTLDGSDDDDPTLVYRRRGGRVLWRPAQ